MIGINFWRRKYANLPGLVMWAENVSSPLALQATKCPNGWHKVKGWHTPERVKGHIISDYNWIFSRCGGQAESLPLTNAVYFQWNEFWPYFHACTLVHKRKAAQKADLHFAMQCKFLVSKYLYIFKSKWCWLGLSDCKPKASMISIFIVLLCHWFIFYFLFFTFRPFHSLCAEYPSVTHTCRKCTHFTKELHSQPGALHLDQQRFKILLKGSQTESLLQTFKFMTLRSHKGCDTYYTTHQKGTHFITIDLPEVEEVLQHLVDSQVTWLSV